MSFVKAASPARITPEVGNTGFGSNAAKVEILMIAPPPCFLHDQNDETRGAHGVQEVDLHALVPVLIVSSRTGARGP